MRLTLLADDGQVANLQCSGNISQNYFRTEGDPIENLLGPSCRSRKVLVSLEQCDYIDSSGISWLIVTHKHFLQGGGRVVFHSVPPRVDHVLQLLKMPSILHVASDAVTARAVVLGEKK